MDVAALLKTLGSDWAGKVESVVQDPAGDAFKTILNFVLSQQVPVDVNRLMFVTPHDLMRVYRASPREGALIEEWRRFRTAAGQLDISSFPDHSATTEARELSFNDKAFLSSRRNVKPILRDVDGFQIFDEGVTPWVPVFLDEWVSTLLPEIERYLGQRWPERIPIILSLHSAHSARFPPDAGLDRDLLSPESTEEDESEAPETDPDALERRWWSYAYGIATRVSEQHNPPTGVGLGSPAVYLNVEHIERLAAQLQVQPEALIAATVAHELSHIVHGHTDDHHATHGWFREGDAQRDSWSVLTSLLGSTRRLTAREARAAQALMARQQPDAYQYFGDFQAGVLQQAPAHISPDPQVFQVGTTRELPILLTLPLTEVPMWPILEKPQVGDLVFLRVNLPKSLAGPWVIVAIAAEPRIGHPKDLLSVVQTEEEDRRQSGSEAFRYRPPLVWLQLRRTTNMRMGPVPESIKLVTRPVHVCAIDEVNLEELADSLPTKSEGRDLRLRGRENGHIRTTSRVAGDR